MKKIAESLAIIALVMITNSAMADYSLSIFYFNDFPARFEPINKYNSNYSLKQDIEGKCFGGIARIKTMLDERRGILDKERRGRITF